MANRVETGKYLNHDIRSNNGSYIIMPPWFQGENGWGNLALPNVYSTKDTASLYPVGTKYVEGERVFYYGRYLGRSEKAATPASTGADELGRIHFSFVYQADMANSLCVRKIAGEDSMWYKTTISAHRTTDHLSGGWVNGKDTGTGVRPFYRRIVAHNYLAAAGSAVTPTRPESLGTTWDNSSNELTSELILDQPIITSKTSLTSMLLPNPWKHVYRETESADEVFYGAMGACCNNNPTANAYVWYQTWGPFSTIWINDFGGVGNREVWYKILGDGSLLSHGTNIEFNQLAGPIMFNTQKEATATTTDEAVAIMVYLMMRR